MNYLLTMLTNGRRDCFTRAAAAFQEFVTPQPTAVYVFDDGGQTGRDTVVELWGEEVVYEDSANALGMCAAYKNCWDAAAAVEVQWVFHLEDDQLILRPVSLLNLRDVMLYQSQLAQIALVRCPWGAEVPHGGYIPQVPGWYSRHSDRRGFMSYEWIETRRNWATSPALMQTELAREFACPAVPGCETSIGPMILDRYSDAQFGLWGWGEPWYAHIGVERQQGAYGY